MLLCKGSSNFGALSPPSQVRSRIRV